VFWCLFNDGDWCKWVVQFAERAYLPAGELNSGLTGAVAKLRPNPKANLS